MHNTALVVILLFMRKLTLFLLPVALSGCLDQPVTLERVTALDVGPTCVTATPVLICDEPLPSPTLEETPTPIPPTPLPTATLGGPAVSDQLLANGSFEGAWRAVIFPEVNTFYAWEPFYRAEPYMAEPQLVPHEWNPPWEPFYFKRPEYKPANPVPEQDVNPYANRVYDGKNAQVVFAFSGIQDAGVFQVIATLPGYTYTVTVRVQLWSAEDIKGGCVRRDADNVCFDWNSQYASSDVASEDDRRGIWAYVKVDPTGGTYVYADTVQSSRTYGYYDGLYDQYGVISYEFVAQTVQSTIFLGCSNRWAKSHNDCYFDAASVSGPVESH